MRALDRLLPKDVWIANMENCGNAGPQMDYYDGMPGRDLIVLPRIVDDGCELHMQMNATMYDRDEIVTGAEAAGVAGIIGQLDKERGVECSTRFLPTAAGTPESTRRRSTPATCRGSTERTRRRW